MLVGVAPIGLDQRNSAMQTDLSFYKETRNSAGIMDQHPIRYRKLFLYGTFLTFSDQRFSYTLSYARDH
jgi:hypothetical protein